MTLRRKIAVGFAGAFAFVLALLLVLPLLFKGRIAERARAEVERTVDAHVDWSGIGLTFFRDFPNLTLRLQDLTVVGVDRFEGDTLAAVGSFRFVLDLGSVWSAWRGRGPVVVRSVRLDRPAFRLTVLEDGTANWDIVRRSSGAPEEQAAADSVPSAGGAGAVAGEGGGRGLNIELRSFELSDGRIVLENASTGLFAQLDGLTHTLDGNFSRDRFVLRTNTHADHASVRFAGTSWLSDVALDFAADLDANMLEGRFVFQDNELRLNNLALGFSGEAVRSDEALGLDLTFAAPGAEFGEVLSLVPAVFAHDFASLETAGTFSLDGSVRGTYGEDAFPAFALRLAVDDGMFRYPDLPLPARAINLDLDVDNPGGGPDATMIDVRAFHVEIGDQPLDAMLTLRTPVSDPDVDASVSGTLDLGAVSRTFKLEGVDELAGVIVADASMRARLSDVDSARYERVAASGTVSATGITLATADLRQPVQVEEATIGLSPQRAELRSFRAQIGSSDVQATGSIDNLLGFALRDEPLRGDASLTSGLFVLDEWRSDDPNLEIIPVPAMLDFALDGRVDRLTFGQLEMLDARGTVRVKDERLTLDGFTFSTLGGRIGVTGYYETVDVERPTFALGLAIDSVDIAGAADAFLTVGTFAPVARYAQGAFSANLDMSGALAPDFTPLFDVLDGTGSLLTSRIALEGFPLMTRLADALELPNLSNPTFNAIRSTIAIQEGRLHVRPFRVGIGNVDMLVSGSNGIDQSLDYTLGLALPRSALGSAADRVLQGLAQRAGRVGLDLQAADSLRIDARVTGTIANPSLELGLGEAVTSLREQVGQAAGAAVEERIDEARQQLDQQREEARARAQARADSIVAQAEVRADTIRAEAARAADRIRAEADSRADTLVAAATNPIARRAAEVAAERIRNEADEQANQLVAEADERADALVAEARRRADELVRGGGEGGRGSG